MLIWGCRIHSTSLSSSRISTRVVYRGAKGLKRSNECHAKRGGVEVYGLEANVVFTGLQKATQDSQVSNCAAIQVCRSVVERQDMSSSWRPSVLLL